MTVLPFVKKFVPEHILKTMKFDTDLSSEAVAAQLLEVQELAQKISEQKTFLKSIHCDIINDDFRQETHTALRDLQDRVKNHFKMIDDKNNATYDEMREMMISLVNEVSALKSQIDENDKILKSLSELEEESTKFCKLFSETSAQTEESYETIPQEISEFGFTDEEWGTLKQQLSKSIADSENQWKDAIVRFFEKLEREYECTKDLAMACWDDRNIEIASYGSILNKVHQVEQTVFSILLFLQQQSVETRNIRETLEFFDHKFKHIHQKYDACWNKGNLCLQAAFDSVEKAKAVLSVGSLAFRDITIDVHEGFKYLNHLLTNFGYAAKLVNDAVHLTYLIDQNVGILINNVANLTSKIEGVYCQKMSKISEVLQMPGEKPHILLKSLEDLKRFDNNSMDVQTSDLGTLKRKCGKYASGEKNNAGNILKEANLRVNPSFEDFLREFHRAYRSNSRESTQNQNHAFGEETSDSKRNLANLFNKINMSSSFEEDLMELHKAFEE